MRNDSRERTRATGNWRRQTDGRNGMNDIFQRCAGSRRSLLVVGFLRPLGIGGGAFPTGRSSISSLIYTTLIYSALLSHSLYLSYLFPSQWSVIKRRTSPRARNSQTRARSPAATARRPPNPHTELPAGILVTATQSDAPERD